MSYFLTQEDGQNLVFLASRICRADMQVLGESAPLPSSRGTLAHWSMILGIMERRGGLAREGSGFSLQEQGPGRIQASEGRLVMGPGLEFLTLGKSSRSQGDSEATESQNL